MSTTNTQIELKSSGASLAAFFFLLIASFLLTGFVPQYLDYLDADCIELSENFEDESQEEKKGKEKESETEKETDKLNAELISSKFRNPKGLQNPDGHFHKWQNPSADIITPPPDSFI